MMMMTPQAILLNVHKKQIPRDIVDMILDYVITPNDKECFTLCIKKWVDKYNSLRYTGFNYAEWYAFKQLNKKSTDKERTTIYNSFTYGRHYNKEKTRSLSYLERVNQSRKLYRFEKLILTQRYNKIKKDYEIKKEMGHKLVKPNILELVGKRIMLNTPYFDVEKTLTNNNIDLDTQYKQKELIAMLNRKHNMKRAIETIKLKYENLDKDVELQDKYNYVKETEKMVVYEDFDRKQTRKKKSNIYDFYVKDTKKDTQKEEKELKYACRNINGFADSRYSFIIINENFDYDDFRCVLSRINPYHNAWHDNFGQTK